MICLASHLNCQKSKDKSNLGGPCRHFGQKNKKFEVNFYTDFSTFSKTWKSTSGAYSFTLSMVLGNEKKNLSFSDHEISLLFHVFSKPLPESVFRGSRCRSCLHQAVLTAIFDFRDFQKVDPWDHLFRRKKLQRSKSLRSPQGASGKRPWRDRCDPKWSPRLFPRSDFHRFWIDFRRILVRFNRIFDPIWTHRDHNTQSTNPQPTTHHPQHTTPRTTSCFSRPLDWAASPSVPSIPRPGGMRASALNPPPPLGGRSVPNQNSRTDRLQSLSRVRTLCRASPKICSIVTTFGPQISDFFRFLDQIFSFPKPSKFRIPPNRPKISKI